MKPAFRFWLPALALPGGVGSETARACATCFGASDSAMAQGMNAGILSLLGVIGSVLLGVAAFAVFLAVRSARSKPAPGEAVPLTPFELAETSER
jgi:hypothetical protein